MGLGWMAMFLTYPHLEIIKGVRVEDFEAFGSYATGKKIAGLQKKDGTMLPLADAMEAEYEVRFQCWEVALDKPCTIQAALMDSIGHNLDRKRSGLWQEMIVDKLSLSGGTQRGPGGKGRGGQGQGQWQAPPTGKGAQVQNPPGTGKRARAKAQAQAGGAPNAWVAAPPPAKWPKGPKGGKPTGKGGKPPVKGGKKGAKGIPAAFQGKTLWCSHAKRICFDHHINGCNTSPCPMCHDCCPEPGCTMQCGNSSHGLWCH